ncbi:MULTISPECIES: SDR family oxidoreductase [unclassified Brevibacterium]|uniref:SDR family oxidoreductase n=1 Tax=unclassified Brevibacterium TaxID=2614124 RepID=UPI000C5CE170|nr:MULTISPECIES: SDR family oxidoreductase [unclassified Brevibacterium]SMX85060.1 all-trans-retinol dehydrogenase (NAD+) [Brevibacterium sp. 239c]
MTRGTKIAGSRVLITGAGSGIGRLMALDAASRGAAEVLIWDLSTEAGQRVADEISATGSQARSFTVNVADAKQVAVIAEDTGPVDVLINCAGIVTGTKLLEADEAAIRRVYDVNTLALYWVTRAFLPGMIERDRGSVVTISSAAGFVGVARQTDYSASKFAAVGFTESLRAELRADGHNVNTLVVCPFYINTGMFEGVTTKFPRLLPILEETNVATNVLDSIESGREQLAMPSLVRILPGARMLPTRAFDKLMDFLGVNKTMDHFTGRRPVVAERNTASPAAEITDPAPTAR